MNDDTDFPAPDPYDPMVLTVLCAEGERRLAKQFHLGANGDVARREFDNALWYTADAIAIDGIEQLHGVLETLETLTDRCVMRGAMTMEPDTRTRRLKVEFPEASRRWLMLDVDGADLLPGVRVAGDPRGSAGALCNVLAHFAPELAGVSAVVQWSTGAGTAELAECDIRWQQAAKPGVSAHVWYILSEPQGEATLTRWVADVNERAGFRLIDPATVRTVQPHYTASPIFSNGLLDPLLGERVHLLCGDRDEAALVIPEAERPVAAAPTADQKPSPQHRGDGAIRRNASGIVIDGRDDHLSRIAFRLVREAAERGRKPRSEVEVIADATWAEFALTTDLSRPRSDGWPWCREDAAKKVKQKAAALCAGTLPATARPASIGRSLATLRALRGES